MSLFVAPGIAPATFSSPGAPPVQLGLFSGPAPTPKTRSSRKMPSFPPTHEQQAILTAFAASDHLVVDAGAGSGKTSTLRMLADQAGPRRSGSYIAYNKAIAAEASRKFPGSVDCRTAHSLAFRAIGHRYSHRIPKPGNHQASKRLPAGEVAKILGLDGARIGDRFVTGPALARLADATLIRWCQSADFELGPEHVPCAAGLERTDAHRYLTAIVVPAARRMWGDIRNPQGRLWFQHDHYLKMWQLTGPRLPVDYILFDEAQDADPVIADIVARQAHAQLVYVGDRSQAIYGWRGAVDAMSNFGGTRLQLTKSFRFGPAIAEVANRWLEMLAADLRIVGHDPVDSAVTWVDRPDAILCRTNGGSIAACITCLAQGRKVGLVGGGKEAKRFAFAAKSLMAGRGCDMPELSAFRTWRELCTYVEEEESGRDLKVLVDLVRRYGPNAIIDTVNRLTPERQAEVVVSTAHKAKGLEWGNVRIGGDFAPPADGERPDRAELMLAYVAVTRAQHRLDPGSLSWPSTGRVNAAGVWWSHEVCDPEDY